MFTTFKFAIEQQDPIWDSLSLTKQEDDYLLEIESFHTPSAEKSSMFRMTRLHHFLLR